MGTVAVRAAWLALLWMAAPASWGAEAQARGLEIALEAWWMAPRGAELDYAFVDLGGSLSGGGEVRSLGSERAAAPVLRAAWRFAAEGAPELRFAAWEQETRGTAATGSLPQAVGALLASPDFAIGRSLVDEASGRARLRVTVAQIEAVWIVAPTPRLAFEATAGVRAFRFEESWAVRYRADLAGTAAEEIVTALTDARGLGPRVALGARYGKGRWNLRAKLGAAFALGDLEASSTDTALLDGSLDRATAAVRPGTRTGFVQLGGALETEVRVARRWVLAASYRFEWWPGVRLEARFVDDVSQNTAVLPRRDAILEGLALGVRYLAGP